MYNQVSKNLILLFVFCFMLLFSLNTSLKSACTGDVDLNGGNIINVDEIIYAPTMATITIDGVVYADFTDLTLFIATTTLSCNSNVLNENVAMFFPGFADISITPAMYTNYCPAGTTPAEPPNSPTLLTLVGNLRHSSLANGCQNINLYVYSPTSGFMYYSSTGWANHAGGTQFAGMLFCSVDNP